MNKILVRRWSCVALIATFGLVACSSDDIEIPDAADSGFKLETNSFAFENFAEGYAESRVTPELAVRMFGDKGVCAAGDTGCTLTPAASAWVDRVNDAMNGGRCEGFAVLSSLFFLGVLKPADFGADSAHKLDLDGNIALQRELAYWFATQLAPVTGQNTKKLMPRDALRFLATFLKPGTEDFYRIGIVRKTSKGISGGHALTPIRYERAAAAGEYRIYVYDNNHPGEERYIKVDTNKNRWEYLASSNVTEPAALYYGDDTNKNPLYFAAVKPRTGMLACKFCKGGAKGGHVVYQGSGEVSVKDAQGNVTGVKGGEVVESGGGTVTPSFSAATWNDTSPVEIAVDTDDLTLTVGGGGGDASGNALNISQFGPGYTVEARDLRVAAGATDTMVVSDGGQRVAYQTTAQTAVNLATSVQRDDGTVLRIAVSVPAGATEVSASVDKMTGELKATSTGAEGNEVQVTVTRTDAAGKSESATVTTTAGANDAVTVQADTWMPGTQPEVKQDKGDGAPVVVADKCQNGMKDTQEADVDCGGPCAAKCVEGNRCVADLDCTTGICDPNTKACVTTLCGNGTKDGTETDVDCGGMCTAKCAQGKACTTGTDCALGTCIANVCDTTDRTVFVSSAVYDGNLGGLAGADAKCQALAATAGLVGTYKAFLSDSMNTAASRLTLATGRYVLVNGTVVANSGTAFFSTTHLAAIDHDENNAFVDSEVWTGSDATGAGTGGCTSWTSNAAGNGQTPSVGLSTRSDNTWASIYAQTCERSIRMYCVRQ